MKRLRLILFVGLLVLCVGCGGEREGGDLVTEEVGTTPTTVSVEADEATTDSAPNPIVPKNQDTQLEWWNDRVFYEIFVRSFYDSDGDGVGDLRGVIEKLDYLNDGDPTTNNDLGVTGIWLMPVTEAVSYHGYDTLDYYAVASDYGTKEDFQALMAAAHERGIAVIVDLVINHTSAENPWFLAAQDPENEKRDWYVWSDDPPTSTGWHETETGFYFGYFWDQMPDLNYRNEAVTAEAEAISRFWLEEMGVDGFRIDAAKHLIEVGRVVENTDETHAWFAGYQAFVHGVKPEALVLGEVWSPSLASAEYVQNDELDLTFDFSFGEALILGARTGKVEKIKQAHERVEAVYPEGQYATFITNHDQNRVVSQLFSDAGRARVAASILLTSPGVPFVYYGEEIGMKGTKPDELLRTPMQWSGEANGGFTTGQPWQPLQEEWETINVESEQDSSESLLTHYRTLIHLRNHWPALRDGKLIAVESVPETVYAYLRQRDDHTILVVVNVGRESAENSTVTIPAERLNPAWTAYNLLTEDERSEQLNADGSITLEFGMLDAQGIWFVLFQ